MPHLSKSVLSKQEKVNKLHTPLPFSEMLLGFGEELSKWMIP